MTSRAPVLLPARVPRAWADTAGWRLTADGGVLLLNGTEVAAAGTVTDVQYVPARTRVGGRQVPESVVLRRDGAGAVVLPVQPWSAWHSLAHGGRDAVDALGQAGFRALLAGLGRDDAYTFDAHGQGDRVRAALATEPRPTVLDPAGTVPSLLRRHARACWVAGVALAVYLPAAGIVGDATGQHVWALRTAGLLAMVTMIPLYVWGLAILRGGRRRLARPVEGAVAAVPGLAGAARLATVAAGDLALVDLGGLETRLPGPAAGGVATAVAYRQDGRGLRAVRLHGTGEDGEPYPVPLAEVTADWWGDTDGGAAAVRDWLVRAGVGWREVTVPRRAPDLVPPPAPWSARRATLWPAPTTGYTGAAGFFGAVGSALAALSFLSWASLPVALPGVLVAAGWVVVAAVRRRDGRRP